MKKFLDLCLKNPQYARVLSALFISGLGTAFTSVAVYNEISRLNFGPFSFALIYAAAILPGLFTSLIVTKYAHRLDLKKILIFGQIIGMLGLIFPLIGSFNHQIFFLLLAEIIASAVGGFLLPIFKYLERNSISEEHFQLVAVMDTVILTANFIFGQGLAALLATKISFQTYLLLDFVTYALALLILFPLRFSFSSNSLNNSKIDKINLNFKQKKALYILPWLGLVCAPPMILLPSKAAIWPKNVLFLQVFTVVPVLFLLCVRTLGQILGPFLATNFDIAKWSKKNWCLPLLLFFYIILYAAAYTSFSLLSVAIFVLLAHLASNVVYTFGNYELLKQFSAEEMIWASGWVYRSMTLIVALSGLLVGFIAGRFGVQSIFIASLSAFLIGSFIIFGNKENEYEEFKSLS